MSPVPLLPCCSPPRRDLHDNQLSGPAPSNFTSSAIGSQLNGTLNLAGNFFIGSPVPYATGTPFCPVNQQGAYASLYLTSLGAGQYGSQRGNCFDEEGQDGGTSQYTSPWDAYNANLTARQEEGGAGSDAAAAEAAAAAPEAAGWFDDGNGTTGSLLEVGSIDVQASQALEAAFAECYTEFQRSPKQCGRFCNVKQKQGPCEGAGSCFIPPKGQEVPTGSGTTYVSDGSQPICDCANETYLVQRTGAPGSVYTGKYYSCSTTAAPAAPGKKLPVLHSTVQPSTVTAE